MTYETLNVRAKAGAETCRWFLRCTRSSAGSRRHPVLGLVPICKECAEKVARLEAETKGR